MIDFLRRFQNTMTIRPTPLKKTIYSMWIFLFSSSIWAQSKLPEARALTCSFEERILGRFIGLSFTICEGTIYHPNGQYARVNGNWYHDNGQYAKIGKTWYHRNGYYAKQGTTWYHPNGQYANLGTTLYFSNGYYAKQGSIWYHKNGYYAKSGNILYHANGQIAGSAEGISELELVQFVTGSFCGPRDFDILCAAVLQPSQPTHAD